MSIGDRKIHEKHKKIDEKHKVRDWWDKADIVSKFATAAIVTVITIGGSSYLNQQQEKTRNNQLLSQFMSDQEKAENQVRKDMFERVLVEFWKAPVNDSCVLETIDQQILQLGLLSRNFHETLDLSPLFTNVLMKIVRNINTEVLKFPKSQLSKLSNGDLNIELKGECVKRAYRRLFSRNNKLLRAKKTDFVKNIKNTVLFNKWKKRNCNSTGENDTECMYKFIFNQHIGKLKNRKKDELINISRRISAKQMESLSDVVERIRLKVNLNKTCVDTKPIDEFGDDEKCYDFGDDEKKPGDLIIQDAKLSDINGKHDKSYTSCQIKYFDKVVGENDAKVEKIRDGIKLHLNDTTARCYSLSVRRAYPKWNQVYVEVMTDRTDAERGADQFGGLANKTSFWLSFFDFPMADNTYLSNKERFAVVLDKLDAKSKEAELSLVYFPAAYAGIKEKAFYQQRLLKYLTEKND